MLKISYASCPLVISAQFTPEKCVECAAAKDHHKMHKTPTSILAFKVIQGQYCHCRSKASVRHHVGDQ